jgi:hypothetical protein
MNDSDIKFIRRLLKLSLVDATKEDIKKIRAILDKIEKDIGENEIIIAKTSERRTVIETCNELIESGQLKIGSKVLMFYNRKLVDCIIANIPLQKSRYLKIEFFNPEVAGSSKPIKYMPKEYFHSLVN